MNGPYCAGGCGARVSDFGKFCAHCWPIDVSSKHVDQEDPICRIPVQESLEDQILRAAYILKFGSRTERADAIETLAHLTNVAQHQSLTNEHNPQKDKKC